MYEELLNIIYTYTINKKVPDDNFIDSIISIIIKEEKLIEYVKDIDYNYQNIALASYFYESRILKFNINKIILISIKYIKEYMILVLIILINTYLYV